MPDWRDAKFNYNLPASRVEGVLLVEVIAYVGPVEVEAGLLFGFLFFVWSKIKQELKLKLKASQFVQVANKKLLS